jgi:hypothetical protein
MREASPTGGALGSISESELGLLKATLGSLRQSQSQEQFQANCGGLRSSSPSWCMVRRRLKS